MGACGKLRSRAQAGIRDAKPLLAGRRVWNVSSTAHGGGVAEMLTTLPSGIEVKLQAGGAHAAIVESAAELGASLVVMGSRRLRGLRALGSVSRRVAHEGRCSVLLVPPRARV